MRNPTPTVMDDLDDIKLEDVAESQSEADLHRWYRAYLEKIDHTKGRLEAANLAGTANTEWVSKCGGFIAIARRIVRAIPIRCEELGFERPFDWLQAGEERQQMRHAQTHKAGAIRSQCRREMAEWLMADERKHMSAPEAAAALLLRWNEKGGDE